MQSYHKYDNLYIDRKGTTEKERKSNGNFNKLSFWQFVILNLINVILSTVRSLTTVKGGKWVASIMNALCYGYYTIIIVITATYEMPILLKCVAVAVVNLVGVFTIKLCEEKMQKEKMWIFNATAKVNSTELLRVVELLKQAEIKLVYTKVTNTLYTMQIFSNSQKESEMIKSILNNYNIKYCAIETKENRK